MKRRLKRLSGISGLLVALCCIMALANPPIAEAVIRHSASNGTDVVVSSQIRTFSMGPDGEEEPEPEINYTVLMFLRGSITRITSGMWKTVDEAEVQVTSVVDSISVAGGDTELLIQFLSGLLDAVAETIEAASSITRATETDVLVLSFLETALENRIKELTPTPTPTPPATLLPL